MSRPGAAEVQDELNLPCVACETLGDLHGRVALVGEVVDFLVRVAVEAHAGDRLGFHLGRRGVLAGLAELLLGVLQRGFELGAALVGTREECFELLSSIIKLVDELVGEVDELALQHHVCTGGSAGGLC